MVENEVLQRFSMGDETSKSLISQEHGFRIVDLDDAKPAQSVEPAPTPKVDRVLKLPNQTRRRLSGNAISLDQEEEIWADLERRIHS